METCSRHIPTTRRCSAKLEIGQDITVVPPRNDRCMSARKFRFNEATGACEDFSQFGKYIQDWVVQSLKLILLLAGCRFNADSYETIEECQAHCITPETTSPLVRYVGKKAECNLSTKVHSSDTYFPRDGPYFL